jgi:hypothetical protein
MKKKWSIKSVSDPTFLGSRNRVIFIQGQPGQLGVSARLSPQLRVGTDRKIMDLHTRVYCGTIHNSQVMETAKMPHH